jgi:hypothetical protein
MSICNLSIKWYSKNKIRKVKKRKREIDNGIQSQAHLENSLSTKINIENCYLSPPGPQNLKISPLLNPG